jgi:hypothetical protein
LIRTRDGSIFIGIVITSISVIAVVGAVLLLAAIVAFTARNRVRANNRFELGSVSQQWLVGHKGVDER